MIRQDTDIAAFPALAAGVEEGEEVDEEDDAVLLESAAAHSIRLVGLV